jgi:predicted aminopeptidase
MVSVLLLMLGTGCSSLPYYLQSVHGHWQLLSAAQPVSYWLAQSDTPESLKERLALSQRMRDFAVSELKLPENATYRRYVSLPRKAAVWNVVAAPELSLQPRTWCFIVVGCVAYRGYYDLAAAREYAKQLQQSSGWDVLVYPVPAYSTLGKIPGDFFSDPLLSTFIFENEANLARLIFHELAHQVAFAPGDTEFNESFASAVEFLGVQRWLQLHGNSPIRAEDLQHQHTRQAFLKLRLRYRDQLRVLYTSSLPDAEKRKRKAQLFAQMREEILQTGWGYQAWAERANNASLTLLGTYDELVDDFVALFDRQGQDFTQFYAEVKRLAALPTLQQRRQALQSARQVPR